MNHEQKMIEMGRIATAMCQLHLEKPEEFDPRTVLDQLFNKFEELELEEEVE